MDELTKVEKLEVQSDTHQGVDQKQDPEETTHIVSTELALSQDLSLQDAIRGIQTASSLPSVSAGLRIQTGKTPHYTVILPSNENKASAPGEPLSPFGIHPPAGHLLARTPSLKAALSPSTSSAASSPGLHPLADITPLPSPIGSRCSTPWRGMPSAQYPPPTGDALSTDPVIITAIGVPLSSTPSSTQKRKTYPGLSSAGLDPQDLQSLAENSPTEQGRYRVTSDYVPEALQIRRPRHVTVSETFRCPSERLSPPDSLMKREDCLAAQRGLEPLVVHPPTPPSSNTADSDSDTQCEVPSISSSRLQREVFEAMSVKSGRRKRWKEVRELGRGTFSRVMLATSQTASSDKSEELGLLDEDSLDPHKLVAVKVIQHGPAGGASEERIENSLKRELEILKSMHHTSLVHLRAFSSEETRSLLVLTYCSGGDMFDLASQEHEFLVPGFIRRIFAELVSATRYLHENLIVHRDIKLENVLLNRPARELPSIQDWQTYPYSIVTLTDMGLSRHIDPVDPKLHTRCGSEDYASPELLMGQAYDGRETDAWALGVLLYALMEGRLPFDPLPGTPEPQRTRARTVHRIARCDWAWVKFADEEGEPSPEAFGELAGARAIVEGLLKRATRRLSLARVAHEEWVRGAIQVGVSVRFQDDWDDE